MLENDSLADTSDDVLEIKEKPVVENFNTNPAQEPIVQKATPVRNNSTSYSASGPRAFQVQKNVRMKRKRVKKKRKKKYRRNGNCYAF